jgi:hypothetical protein
MNAVIADNKRHAEAMIQWMGLDPDQWLGLVYGDRVEHMVFDHVYIVRPHEGIEEWQGDWFVEQIIGRTSGKIDTLPKGWRPQEDRPRENELPLQEAVG